MSLHLLAFPAAFCKMSEVMFRLSEAISLRQGYRLDHPVGEASTFLAGVSCSYLPPGGLDQ